MYHLICQYAIRTAHQFVQKSVIFQKFSQKLYNLGDSGVIHLQSNQMHFAYILRRETTPRAQNRALVRASTKDVGQMVREGLKFWNVPEGWFVKIRMSEKLKFQIFSDLTRYN